MQDRFRNLSTWAYGGFYVRKSNDLGVCYAKERLWIRVWKEWILVAKGLEFMGHKC
jgi:hypothetical protein